MNSRPVWATHTHKKSPQVKHLLAATTNPLILKHIIRMSFYYLLKMKTSLHLNEVVCLFSFT